MSDDWDDDGVKATLEVGSGFGGVCVWKVWEKDDIRCVVAVPREVDVDKLVDRWAPKSKAG